jgi:hypothetical protein
MKVDERGLRIGAMLFGAMVLNADEIWTRFGSVEVSAAESGFRVREGAREWKVDLASLIRAKDCALPYIGNERICQGPPNLPCPACARNGQVIAFDEHYRRIYFVVTTGNSWDKPWGIYNYSLKTHRFMLFAGTWAAYIQLGVVSYSGRYLAYLKSHHQSAAGPCISQTDIEIVDLWDRRIGKPMLSLEGPPDQCGGVNKLTWSSRSELEFGGVSYGSVGTEALGKKFDGRIDVGTVVFH